MPDSHLVQSTGLRIAVREYDGRPDGAEGPHVVLVHGYPDHQLLWRPVAERLRDAGMHAVTYDVRGAGRSDVPSRTEDYRTELLVDDLVAVLEATVPDREPVHLVGHDWGSVQLWEAVLAERDDPRLRARLASFTSISGPALEHLGRLARNPRGRQLRLLRQAAHSWYVYWFHVPVLPELGWRAVGALSSARGGGWNGRDGANGVNLYRANVRRNARRQPPRHTDVPVLVVAPRRDPFLTDVTLEDLDLLCSSVRVVRPDTGHWVPRTHPDLVADLVRGHVTAQG